MSRLYGIPYQGSKTKICGNILAQLPRGNRFVDLFGGGFAMSHAARLSGKYKRVLYNEIEPMLVELIRRALNGEFNYNRFKPEFITRERFFADRDKDGYIKYIWSFSSSGKQYMFSKELEPLKREAHDFVVFGKHTEHFAQIERKVTSTDIHMRRIQFCGECRRLAKRFDLQQLEQLERLIELSCGSYDEYDHKDGDIVYCDPPYEGTADYGNQFDFSAFYQWVASRPYQVWFSSYQGVKDFRMVWAHQLRSSFGSGNRSINYECLYTNK